MPPQLKISSLSDQSIFVRSAISGVVREAIIAACLTAVMILVFLGSLRSTLIIAVSIPLSILCSLASLAALHETINIMTLGGLALAVGILVDDATVEIENINRNLESGKEIEQAILDGAAQIATPALVSTLSICIVFVPMFLLSGVARYLFVPLAEAVVFAMLASYLLSRTVVPTMAKYLLHEHDDAEARQKTAQPQSLRPLPTGLREPISRDSALVICACSRCASIMLAVFLIVLPDLRRRFGGSASCRGWARTSSPPSTPASSRFTSAPAPARASKRRPRSATTSTQPSARRFPPSEVVTIVDNIGLPYSGLNLSYSTSAPIGPADADIQVQLTPGSPSHRRLTSTSCARCWPANIPASPFTCCRSTSSPRSSTSASAAPIDIQIVGPNLYGNRALAEQHAQRSPLRSRRGRRPHPAALRSTPT